MQESNLFIWVVSIMPHGATVCHRYRGVAVDMEQALKLAEELAEQDGLGEFAFDEANCLGPICFAPWLSMADEEDEVARMDDKLTQVEALERGEVTHENG